MKSIRKTWRDSSSLLLLSKSVREKTLDAGNLEILVQTRPEKASTFASSVVFPGGVTESVDNSPQWTDLIKSFGYTNSNFNALYQIGENVSPLFQNNPIQSHVSLRITAIRETFEELGVLVCSKEKKSQRTDYRASFITDFDVKYWQKQVSKEPSQLFNLCQELGVYPDIWSLHYWSNWLTPTAFKKRFDTAFFIAALKDRPEIQESSEVLHATWTSPAKILEQKRKNQVVLAPPQSYEFIRLCDFRCVDEVIEFAAKTSPLKNVLYYPVVFTASDGSVHLLPGDDLYPTLEDYNLPPASHKNKTLLELREGCESLHRLETQETSTFIIKNLQIPNHINMNDKIIFLN